MNDNDRINEMVRLAAEVREADNEFETARAEEERIVALMQEDLERLNNGG